MKEHAILFSTPMVQAILQGRKTQTRRVIKPQPDSEPYFAGKVNMWYAENKPKGLSDCPYGQPGDLLWVRETWKKADIPEADGPFEYKASLQNPSAEWNKGIWKPSIHMPKAAARIWLKVKDVRVECLQKISQKDAIAEGIETLGKRSLTIDKPYYKNYISDDWENGWLNPINSFDSLWCKINGEQSWYANPWVWVVEFEVVSTTGKPKK